MAITVYGVEGSVDEAHWSQLMSDVTTSADNDDFVPSGLEVTAATGTIRTVNVAAGRSYQVGTDAVMSAPQTVSFLANTSGQPRDDIVTMQVDFTKPMTTAGSLVVVKGVPSATPVAPSLTQKVGVLWQTQLARVRIANGAGQLNSTNVTDTRMTATTARNVPIPGNYADDPTIPLTVRRHGRIAEFSGRFQRTVTNVPVQTATMGSVIIPEGFRPQKAVTILAVSNVQSGTPKFHHLLISPDGTADLIPMTGALNVGETVRIQTTHWIIGS